MTNAALCNDIVDSASGYGRCGAGCASSECHFGSNHAALFEVVFNLINTEELYISDINSLQIGLNYFFINDNISLINYVEPFIVNIDSCDEEAKDECGVCPNEDNLNNIRKQKI